MHIFCMIEGLPVRLDLTKDGQEDDKSNQQHSKKGVQLQ